MSGEQRFDASIALPLARRVVDSLSDLCERIEIAGSLRRGKPAVGDVEIVALPKHPAAFLARIDRWIVNGTARKARYPDGRYRYGERYRGLAFDNSGLKVEIFVADAVNYGYQLWLRTGPGDANQYVMQQCIYHNAPFRAAGGYWLTGDGRRISVPDEQEMFRLLGMGFVPPAQRTLELYAKRLARPQWATTWTLAEEDAQPVQGTLF